MRRSKSDPSKYTRNYRSISQRRMTEYDEVDEEKEMERLRSMLRNSESHLDRARQENDSVQHTAKRKKGGFLSENERAEGTGSKEGGSADCILSEEMKEELGTLEGDILVLPPKKKKAKKAKTVVALSPAEIRQAKQEQKKITRKLKQLADRVEQKKRRTDLYAKLKDHAISAEESQLLSSSSTLGKKISKREALKKALQKERAGIVLTAEECSLLYTERTVSNDDDISGVANWSKESNVTESKEEPVLAVGNSKKKKKRKINGKNDKSEKLQQENFRRKNSEMEPASSKETESIDEPTNAAPQDSKPAASKAPKTQQTKPESFQGYLRVTITDDKSFDRVEDNRTDEETGLQGSEDNVSSKQGKNQKAPTSNTTVSSELNIDSTEPTESKPASFAAQMMSSLLNLKDQCAKKTAEETKEAEKAKELEEQRLPDEKLAVKTPYVPINPAILKTAAAMGLESTDGGTRSARVVNVDRPAEVKESRSDLPVCGMEYEIIDAVRNNDVTIICSQTGSGKSTQVPQFLYETGFSQGTAENEPLLIGVTQPRRVAAVSTAKRVCYEMGQGDGQTIKRSSKNNGNLVAYQTRYESAGLGAGTHIKFMTDGILLQEIQSDLLLRKYGVIVLDEAHERNLNTDVLLGLLSVAMPLRRKAAEEQGSGILPLKVIVMSATLRVEDFTENEKLFPAISPAVVKVPGRMYPVTIHHSKVTELDDYETAAFNKVCKIHRKLPQGGILVFLTGKQEIVRMVNRLKKAFGAKSRKGAKARYFSGMNDISVSESTAQKPDNESRYRDMDDDEFDGDLYQNNDDDFDVLSTGSHEVDAVEMDPPGHDEAIPKHVHVLPLYSMLAVEEQAKVFAAVPDGHRLIVVCTNIAETSLTIPGITYVVDTGRQKCRNYHSGTGVASYDVMWISKAAADQRAGRAGRNSPGHCYRLYSSSMYSRHMDAFALPEVLTRPLEDVVLAMKAMNVDNVASFPFPTPPNQKQIMAAVNLLANIGCVDLSKSERLGSDGEITRLGAAVSGFPLGVRYGKMLMVAAQAGVLDYAIAMVAVLSESSPFDAGSMDEKEIDHSGNEDDSLDEVDRNAAAQVEKERQRNRKRKWIHRGGDVLAGILAVGAYAYAGRNAGGATEKAACRKFCEANGLNFVVMGRIQKMRVHLAKLAKARLSSAKGMVARTGAVPSLMSPPNRLQENLLMQALASGLLDNVAVLAPPGSLTQDHPFSLRSAYVSCSSSINEPMFMDRASVLYSRDSRKLPEWVCYDSVVRKVTKDGVPVLTMKTITPIDPAWLGALSTGSRLLSLGVPLPSPLPSYDPQKDAVMCSVTTKFGSQGWDIPPVQVEMFDALQSEEAKRHSQFLLDDSFRWFGRFLLEGKVFHDLKELPGKLNDDPAVITRKTPVGKVALLVAALSSAGVDSAAALTKHWTEVDNKFLFKHIMSWAMQNKKAEVKRLWVDNVKKQVARRKAKCSRY